MTFILASARHGYEFRTADAINEMGGDASVPRRIDVKKMLAGDLDPYLPFLPNFIFVSVSEEMWYAITRKRLFGPQGILPPVRRQMDILPKVWLGSIDRNGETTEGIGAFIERAEKACWLRLEQYEAGLKVARYRKGDMIRIVGPDLLTGEMGERIARVLKISDKGIEVDDGSQMMGKPITRVVTAAQIVGMAAE